MKVFWISLLMIVITALRIYIPNGVTMGLLYGFPIFLSTPIKGIRWMVPAIVLLVASITSFMPPRAIPFDISILDKGSMVLFLLAFAYLGSIRCSRNAQEICSLEDINHDLACRIQKYDNLGH